MTDAAQSFDDLLFIQVGGTIDKDYPAGETNHGYEFEIGVPDSLDMQDAHRAEVRAAVEAASQTRIIITHGTDTMGQTAATLAGITGKTIVLTGAMLPEKFRDSDADFNLGMAIAAVRLSQPGVYVALNGTVTPAA